MSRASIASLPACGGPPTSLGSAWIKDGLAGTSPRAGRRIELFGFARIKASNRLNTSVALCAESEELESYGSEPGVVDAVANDRHVATTGSSSVM